ncbi:HlyD family type I secretion periplasmic adaptor subunit [Rhodovulum sp. 12E13]|uniref:HlyD family type I secretion periplasmic adaptor subunit n=1 Tax=Rhodovulum sp. 12E13 TaxID=2203891 RepID=UPI000E122D73|nr:HlyD family type I secretion periplasmic adaptor subunit [Rhodovulum sp. 12E13]RDC74157.1 HlyD family type I secretion periplasmic adaptor subunit [Rhodovulum sp. 12E13]
MSRTVDIVEWHHQVPRSIHRQAIFGIVLLVVALGGFGAWAVTAPLAAAVIAQGSFVATGRNKIVQHLEGGIIERVVVSEGDRVSEGDPLIELDRTAAEADRRELKLRQARLEAAEARVRAELALADEVRFAPELLALAEEFPEIRQILRDQRLAFEANIETLTGDLAILENGIASLEVRARGYRAQLAAHEERAAILLEEMDDKQALLESGHLRRPELNAVRRVALEASGHVARLRAEVEEIGRARTKFELEVAKLKADLRQSALDELQGIQAELDSIREQARKAEAVLQRSSVLAPVAGTVIRLHYHGAGGVIETGKPIAEILPADAPLLIETFITRTDIDNVHVGQAATVRLSALNQRTTPVLQGRVSYVSADAVSKSGDGVAREVYVAHIDVSPQEYRRADRFSPVPGMPAEIMIKVEERTFFDYLSKPIRDSMSRAFREP